MTSPLIDRLTSVHGFELLDRSAHDAFVKRSEHALLFFPGDPVRYPESNDVAVVLPELVKACGHIPTGVVAASAELELQRRYGFTAWPALVFLRRGEYLGCITRIHDWSTFVEMSRQLLQASPKRAPGIGIPLVSATPSCH